MFQRVTRERIKVDPHSLVTTGWLFDGEDLPLLIQPAVDGVDLAKWSEQNLDYLERILLKHGGFLFRGFQIDTVERFDRFARSIFADLSSYKERTAPRRVLAENIYSSTEHPSDQYIHFHNANSYSHRWPLKIWFCCIQPALEMGRTPIADCRKVYQLIDPKIREEFAKRKIMYLRNFREHVGLPWQETFQTEDPNVVREYCRKAGIEIELFERDRLRTRQVRSAIQSHPKTHEIVWFNQAHLFHIASLAPEVSRRLTTAYAEEDLPRNAYYGDGSPIPVSVVQEIIECYRKAEISFPWEKGDVLMLDNMLAAHSRTPYKGERLIAVTFADIYSPYSELNNQEALLETGE